MSARTGPALELQARVLAFIDTSLAGHPSEDWFLLARDIWRHQCALDPVARALAPSVEPTRPAGLPAVPVDLFKRLPVGTVSAEEAGACFMTSGTTVGHRGAHRLHDTLLYETGALAWFRRCVPDAPAHVVALLANPATNPESSLSHMVQLFGCSTWTWSASAGLDAAALQRALHGGPPTFIATTAFALAEWLDTAPPPAPEGSMVMVTGGFKGRLHKLDHVQLYRRAAEVLGARIVTEYGMTELSSQLWSTPERPYRPPPWLRVVAIAPSGQPLAAEELGQLRFYDLANVDSALGVETADVGVVHADGTVTLEGRLSDAPDRGCSLSVEEAWLKGRS